MRYQLGTLAIALALVSACDYNKPEDYDGKKDFKKYQAAQVAAKEAAAKSQVKVDPAVAMLKKAEKSYSIYCASCHGADGKADSPTANALNPKPRNFADKAWQKSVDDAHIAKVIKEGGPAVGLSPTMAPWGASLSDADIEGLVKVVRNYGK